jgi:hypothetical protein
MARPTSIDTTPSAGDAIAPLHFIALPDDAYAALSKAAARRNLTFAQLLSEALAPYMNSKEG